MIGNYDADFLATIADLLDHMPRVGHEKVRAIMLTDAFARELAAGLRRIAERMKT